MANIYEEFNTILPRIISDLNNMQEQIKLDAKELRNEVNSKEKRVVEVDAGDLTPEQAKEYAKLEEDINDLEKLATSATAFLNVCKSQKEIIRRIYDFNPLSSDSQEFIKLIDSLLSPDVDEDAYNIVKSMGTKVGVKYRILSNEMSRVDELYTAAINISSDNLNFNNTDYLGDKVNIIGLIKFALGSKNNTFFERYYDINIDYLNEVIKRTKKEIADAGNRLSEIESALSKKVRNEIIDDLQGKKDSIALRIQKLENISKLANKYDEKGDQESLMPFLDALLDLNLITSREYKLIAYEEKEEKPVEETPVEEKEEIQVEKEIMPLDGEYFVRPETQFIMCFAGDDGDDIYYDLYEYLEKQDRLLAEKELIDTFNGLYLDKNYLSKLGKKPLDFYGNDKTVALVEPPLNFDYKRLGTHHDSFRMHAITRYSHLLAELGFGSGNIILFGAAGKNKDDKTKSETYQRMGKRCIAALSQIGEHILTNSLDNIEHITRRYIPKSLLSPNDIERDNNHQFAGKHKETGLDRKKGDYFLYDVLDDESKQKVYNFLHDYFEMQTTKMFEIIKDYENNKNKSYE